MAGDIEQSVIDQVYYFTNIHNVVLNEISHSGWKRMCMCMIYCKLNLQNLK